MLKRLFATRELSNEEWSAAQEEWRNPANWHWGVYRAPGDPHVWVRKQRAEFGWTLNLAHRASWVIVVLFVVGLALLLRVLPSTH